MAPYAGDVGADFLDRRIEFLAAAAHDENVGTLGHEPLCRGEPYSRGSAGNDSHFVLKLAHHVLL